MSPVSMVCLPSPPLEDGHLGQTVGLTLCVRRIGETVTNDDYDEYLTRLSTFRAWFDKTIMSLSSESDDIMVLPASIAAQKYRDEPPRYVVDYAT